MDEINISVRAGNGGAGCVSFARRKYQPFAGPDGGDGGKGGDVVLYGEKGTESLYHFRNTNLKATPGTDGSAARKNGSMGEDLLLRVPLGTLAYDERNGLELGTVTASNQRLVVARGGKGGRGNPHFKTSTNRAPKAGDPGVPGEVRDLLLKQRVYATCGLMEPCLDEGSLLPLLLKREASEIDRELYFTLPRWIRVIRDYVKYDPVYLPLRAGAAECGHVIHLYWLEHLFINLSAFGDMTSLAVEGLTEQIVNTDHPRLKTILIAGSGEFRSAIHPDLLDEQIEIETMEGDRDSVLDSFISGLSGDPVE